MTPAAMTPATCGGSVHPTLVGNERKEKAEENLL